MKSDKIQKTIQFINDRRLIEDYLPIQAISKEASWEMYVGKGQISILHHQFIFASLKICRLESKTPLG